MTRKAVVAVAAVLPGGERSSPGDERRNPTGNRSLVASGEVAT